MMAEQSWCWQAMKRNSGAWYVAIVIALFFIIYASFPFIAPATHISPDETANAFFAHSVAMEGRLWFIEPRNFLALDRAHPRSMESHAGLVVPSTFFGLPLLYGAVAKIIGLWTLPYLTTFFSLSAALMWYAILKQFFGKIYAMIGILLLLAHPAWWYYAMRGWHHNVLFASACIAAAYFFFVKPFSRVVETPFRRFLDHLGSGTSIFFAMLIRPTEIAWIAPSVCIVSAFYAYVSRSRFFSVIHVTKFLCGAALIGLCAHAAFTWLLSNPFIEVAGVASDSSLPSSLIKIFFPFGFDMLHIGRIFFEYYVVLAWWYTLPLCVGLWHILKMVIRACNTRNVSPDAVPWIFLCVMYVMATVMLVLWYGSWHIKDNPDPRVITLANSYVRYFLPSYILSIPIVIAGVEYIASLFAQGWSTRLARIIIFAALFLMSGYRVYTGVDGIPAVANQLRVNAAISDQVMKIVPRHGILITDRHDKLFFPHRNVMFPITAAGTLESASAIKDFTPLYIYDLSFDDAQFQKIDARYDSIGLHLVRSATFGKETLYALVQN